MDQNNLIKFLSYWILNTLILLIFSAIFTKSVVLGNAQMIKSMAAVLNALVLTALIYALPQIVQKMNIKLKDEKVYFLGYFVLNSLALWVLKRLADFTGLGISSILFVIVLAALVAGVDTVANKYIVKLLKKQVK